MGLKVNSIQVDQNFDFGNVSIGGKDNTISGNSTYSTILAGQNNTIGTYSYNSVILGGSGLELDNENNVVLVPSLKIATASNVSADRILVWDTDNYVKYREVSTISGGGSVAINTDEVGFGTGTGLTSSGNFKFNATCNNLIAASKGGDITSSENSVILGGECYSGTPYQGKSGGNQIIGGRNNLVTGGFYCNNGNTYNFPNSIYDSCSSTILGGRGSIIGTSSNSTISGGFKNKIYSSNSSILGGLLNFIDGNTNTIVGGVCNEICNNVIYASIISGQSNKIEESSYRATILGGSTNRIAQSSYDSAIITGYKNQVLNSSCCSVIVGGKFNTIATQSNNSSIIGGSGNKIYNGDCSVIIGGLNNYIGNGNLHADSIVGGKNNSIIYANYYSSIVGGSYNSICYQSCYSSIISGKNNLICDQSRFSGILSGQLNTIDTGSCYATIIGGLTNSIINSPYSSIIGGKSNIGTQSCNSVILGGQNLELYCENSVVYVPTLKIATASSASADRILVWDTDNYVKYREVSTISPALPLNEIAFGSGTGLTSSAQFQISTYAGSINTLTNSNSSSIIGGFDSSICSSDNSSIIGGYNNTLYNSNRSIILGGKYNTIATQSNSSSIIGGDFNTLTYQSYYSSIIGGRSNTLTNNSYHSSIIGGQFNNVVLSSNYSSIIGGKYNIISTQSSRSSIIGGQFNKLSYISNWSSIVAGWCNTLSCSYYASIIGGMCNTINDNSTDSSIIGGMCNRVSYQSANSSIIGGCGNTATQSDNSVILGGLGLELNSENEVVYVPKLKIATASNVSASRVLVWDDNNYVGYRDLSSIVSGTFSGTFSVSDGRTSVVDNGQIKDIFYYGEIGYTGTAIDESTINAGLSVVIGDYYDNGVDKVTFKTDTLFTVIDDGFTGNTFITSVILHGATGIGIQSFIGCASLTSIDLPQVQTIGDASFYDCTSLDDVKIPKCVTLGTNNGDNAVFSGCASGLEVITNISLNTDGDLFYVVNILSGTVIYVNPYDSVYGVFSGTFSVSDGRTSVVDKGQVKDIFYYGEIGYTGSPISKGTINAGLSVVIRDYYDNGVDKITFKTDTLFTVVNNGFDSNTSITSLVLHGATGIGDTSFNGCTNLTTIDLPQVQTIGDSSFFNCVLLTVVYFPQVQTIGDYSFVSALLTTIDLPLVQTIGVGSFQGCSVTTIDLPQVTTIGDSSFEFCTLLGTASLPQVQTIGDQSFNGCTLLTSVKIPKCTTLGTTTGDDSVFNSCASSLEIITNIIHKTSNSGNPDGDLVYVIDTLSGTVIYVNDYAYEFVTGTFSGTFSVSDGRTSVVDNGQIKDIYYYGEIGYTGTAIDESTINAGLSGVTIRDYYDNGVDKVTFKTDLPFTVVANGFQSNASITSLVLHGATGIGDYSFDSCSSLTTIDLPQVITIGDYSFQNCAFTTLYLPQVITIGDYSFLGCSSLTTIDLPEVQTLGEGSFESCTSLTAVNLPQVQTLGSFYGCTSLTTIDLPQVQTLGIDSFNGCTLLGTASLPQVQTIGNNSFTGCISLTSIDLPQVTTIGDNSFNGCTLLISVKILKCITLGTTTSDNGVFTSCAAGLEVITNILLKTSNSGNPDDDLLYVINTLSGTVIYVNDYNYSISIPNNQVAFGSLTGLTSSSAFTFKSGPSESNLIIGGSMSSSCCAWSPGSSIISRNSYMSSSTDSSIIGGSSNCLFSSPYSAIIGGIGGEISSSKNSVILGGERYTGTPYYGQSGGSQIIGGKNNLVTGGFFCNNYGTTYNYPNRVCDSISSSILGGRGNILESSSNSAIIGGFGLTLSNENDVVLVPTLKIATASNDDNLTRILVWDDNNYVGYREVSSISSGVSVNIQTVLSYTMSLVDAGSTLIMDNSIAQNIIIDTYANVAFVAGTKIDVVQIGSGTVSFSAEPGVTLNSKNSYTRIANQYSAATLLNISSDNWVLIGNLTS